MEFTYICRDDDGQQYIEITGVTDASRILRIPPAIGGKPVRIIGAHAFEKNEVIEQIFLPESVRAVGIFAFYGCPNLRMLSLSDMAESWGTGAIYFCGKLSEIRLTVMRRRYSILRDMLNDTDKGLYVRITEPEYGAELYFPAFTNGFDEDTYARQFHTWIEGCGFAYRETVMRNGIDFRGYDQLFARAMADGVGGVQNAANIALARLMSPCNMKDTAGDKYEKYLRDHGQEILLRLVREHDRERAMFLLDRGYASAEAAGNAVLLASGQGDAELVGMLMRQRSETLTGMGNEDTFDLGDL